MLQIVNGGGAVVATTATDAAGLYSFVSAGAGYTLDAITPYTLRVASGQIGTAGLLPTDADTGADRGADSNGQPLAAGNGVSDAIVTPIDGIDDLTFDFGFRQVALDGVVFIDTNADGQRDEPNGEQGYTVTLYAADGTTVIGSTTTSADGSYSFTSQVRNSRVWIFFFANKTNR